MKGGFIDPCGKRPYATRPSAEAAAEALAARYGKTYEAYYGGSACGNYHVRNVEKRAEKAREHHREKKRKSNRTPESKRAERLRYRENRRRRGDSSASHMDNEGEES